MNPQVRVVRASERAPIVGLPPGVGGEQLLLAEDRWVARAILAPGKGIDWHHHGDWETFAYFLGGRMRLDYALDHADDGDADGDAVRSLEIHAGDFVHLPPHTRHRETNVGAEEVVLIVVRLGLGPMTTMVPNPRPSDGE